MRKSLLMLLFSICVAGFTACESKTNDANDSAAIQENTDAAEGNTETGIGAAGTDNQTGQTGTAADSAADTTQAHDHSDPNHKH